MTRTMTSPGNDQAGDLPASTCPRKCSAMQTLNINGKAITVEVPGHTHDVRAILENVSRRGLIGGAAAIGALVVGMRVSSRSDGAAPVAASAGDLSRFNSTAVFAAGTPRLLPTNAYRSYLQP